MQLLGENQSAKNGPPPYELAIGHKVPMAHKLSQLLLVVGLDNNSLLQKILQFMEKGGWTELEALTRWLTCQHRSCLNST